MGQASTVLPTGSGRTFRPKAGIDGLNVDAMPEWRWHYGYFVMLAVIATVCGGLYGRFRTKQWL